MTLLMGLGVGLLVMLAAWCVYLITKNPGIVDVFWGLNILIIGSYYLLSQPVQSASMTLALILLLLWGLRLSLFLLLTRILKREVDKRYVSLSQSWKEPSTGFLYNFLFQGFLAWLIAIPFWFIASKNTLSPYTIFLCVLIIIGLFGESIADWQLHRFKAQGHQGICQLGLWQYARHPNYFFELIVWFGFSLMGISGAFSLLSLISFVSLWAIMWFLTIPITEKESLKRRGAEYEAYQAGVNCLIPFKMSR